MQDPDFLRFANTMINANELMKQQRQESAIEITYSNAMSVEFPVNSDLSSYITCQ